MTFYAFQVRLSGYLSRTLFLCIILSVLSLVGDRVVAQTLTSDLKKLSTQELFDPNGYYFPVREGFVVGGWKIEWFDIQALEYYYDDVLHYDRPRPISPVVRLTITRQKDQKKFSYKCPNPVVSQEVLTIVCSKTSIGTVSIQGSFIDKRGQFWDRKEIIPYKTVVLNATITVEDKLGQRIFRQIPFTYWEGD